MGTLLPGATLLVSDPGTVLPIREITAILRRSCPGWAYKEVAGAGHMAPLTRPDLINPLVGSFLRMELCDDRASPMSSGTIASGATQPVLLICKSAAQSLIVRTDGDRA